MNIDYSPKFKKQFKKLPKYIKNLALKQEEIFRKDPFDLRLKTHKLQGTTLDYWAFSVSHSYRIGFVFCKDNSVRFLAVGGHEIYKKDLR